MGDFAQNTKLLMNPQKTGMNENHLTNLAVLCGKQTY